MSFDYEFHDPALSKRALTHPSAQRAESYERLEFLGDAVLGVIISDFLYHAYPEENEGALAKRRAALVCGATLADVARKLAIDRMLILGEGEAQSGGRDNDANLENALEALIGAIYLDGGLEAVRKFVLRHIAPLAESMAEPPKDPKTRLQEKAQAEGRGIPEYAVMTQTGPSHAPHFTVRATVSGWPEAKGEGGSKREAERKAAEALLSQLENND